MTRTELLKITKPILFNTDMTVAILKDRKTVTRRLIKPQLSEECPVCKYCHNEYIYDVNAQNIYCARCGEPLRPEKSAPYQPGDILYVRESVFQGVGHYLDVSGETVSVLTHEFEYYADGLHEKDHWKDKYERTWMHRRPAIHMPKEAARIFLKVKGVRLERLQDITEEQAKAEGICEEWAMSWWKPTYTDPDSGGYPKFRDTFGFDLWDTTVKKSELDKYGWAANPWVWVIEFERIEADSEV